MFENIDYLIVGAGFYGAVCAHELAKKGYGIGVIDKRPHMGGNCHDQIDPETGIRFHQYGPHIFHCESERVLAWLKDFCEFNSYFHQVLASHAGALYQLPFNLATINKFYNRDFTPGEARAFLKSVIEAHYRENPANLRDKCVNMVGPDLYEAFIAIIAKNSGAGRLMNWRRLLSAAYRCVTIIIPVIIIKNFTVFPWVVMMPSSRSCLPMPI